MFFLLGIDDTNTESSGSTAALAEQLGSHLESSNLVRLINISSHQLLQHPSICHTRDNIASCLLLDSEERRFREIDLACRELLHHKCAPAANPGYALATWGSFDRELVTWGNQAKQIPLTREDAINLARHCGISTAGIFGSGNGVIGALAAVGLRFNGSDGWITWMPGLSAVDGIYTQSQLNQIIHFDLIETEQHRRPALDDLLLLHQPVKPLLKDGRVALAIHAAPRGADYQWQT